MQHQPPKIGVALNNPANLRLMPVVEQLAERHHAGEIKLTVFLAAAMLDPHYGAPGEAERFANPGYQLACLHLTCQGDRPGDKLDQQVQLLKLYNGMLHHYGPFACMVLIGDRFETWATATACHAYRVPICHFQGGEQSGTRDDGYRRGITQLASWHVPATDWAARCIERQRTQLDASGEPRHWPKILAVGCPSADIDPPKYNELAAYIAGRTRKPLGDTFIFWSYHPDTDHPEQSEQQLVAAVKALNSEAASRELTILARWPNIDAGGCRHAAALRKHADRQHWLFIDYLPENFHAAAIKYASKCVGNSSAFVRDSGRYGTPVSLIGQRQQGRQCGDNVATWPSTGYRNPNTIYGTPGLSARVVEKLLIKLELRERAQC